MLWTQIVFYRWASQERMLISSFNNQMKKSLQLGVQKMKGRHTLPPLQSPHNPNMNSPIKRSLADWSDPGEKSFRPYTL